MVKRIPSTAWRTDVSADGRLFSLSVRTEIGREYEVIVGTVDSTPLLTDLLNEVGRVYAALPPQNFAEGAGPNHPRSQPPLRPLRVVPRKEKDGAVLLLDFGGTVLKVAIDPAALKAGLEGL